MAILKFKEIEKMNENEINEKLKELKAEIIKARVASGKSGKANLREIKRTTARLMTQKTRLKLNKKMEVRKK
jgi:ribosomal protein L29